MPAPIAARPAPISFAASASMIVNSFSKLLGCKTKLVKVDRVVYVEQGQKSENISLDNGDQNFQRADADHQGEARRSEEHTSELPSLMRISYAVFCLKKKKHIIHNTI